MRYVLALLVVLFCSCSNEKMRITSSEISKKSKDDKVDIPGMKDTVTVETNLGLSPKYIYDTAKFENAYTSLGHMRKALGSFAQLTESLDKSVLKEPRAEIANMDWETQNLGFHNWANSVEAMLLKQDYLIKKMEYEWAAERFESGRKVSLDTLSELKLKFSSSQKSLVKYFNAYQYAD